MTACEKLFNDCRSLEREDWFLAVEWAQSWTENQLQALCESDEDYAEDLYVRILGLQRGEKSLR